MREIKFRVFDYNGQMVFSDKDYGGDLGMFFGQMSPDGEDVMQHTGLKDRHGVEIYEGDILRVPATNDYEKTTYNSFEVFWHDNDATPTDCGLVLGRLTVHGNSSGGYGGYKLIPKDVGRMEVIGNIYENPGLLKPVETPKLASKPIA